MASVCADAAFVDMCLRLTVSRRISETRQAGNGCRSLEIALCSQAGRVQCYMQLYPSIFF